MEATYSCRIAQPAKCAALVSYGACINFLVSDCPPGVWLLLTKTAVTLWPDGIFTYFFLFFKWDMWEWDGAKISISVSPWLAYFFCWFISGSWRRVLDLLRCQLDYRLLSRNVAPIIYAPLILLKFLSAPPLHVCLLLCHHLVFFGILYLLLSSLPNRLLLFLVSLIVFSCDMFTCGSSP